PAVRQDDRLTDVQAQAGALQALYILAAVVPLEDVRDFVERQPDASVAHQDRGAGFIDLEINLDPATIGRVFDRVAEQVLDDFFDAPCIPVTDHPARRVH